MDLTVLFLAVPALSADLEPSSSQLLWITDIYGFLLAGLLNSSQSCSETSVRAPSRRNMGAPAPPAEERHRQ